MTTADVVAKVMAGEHGDFVRDAVALVARELMEAEISAEVGAERGVVSSERVTHRNGYRLRPWETRVGEIELLIPRKRQGPAYFPSFLEPRRRSEQAIVAVVLEAYVNGVSTRKVDRLVEQLGIAGMTKDRVSALCRALDEQVKIFRERPLEGSYPYLWLDAKHVKVRSGGHVRSKALVIAYAVHETGIREVIGLDIGEIESEAFWVEFLRSLRARGLSGCAWRSLTITKGSSTRSSVSSHARGSAAPCISFATCTSTAGPLSAGWSPRRSESFSRPRTASRHANASAR
jgi:transposase-like protein